jgi:RNA polymerase sigma-70 factor, ECF subfamily
MPFWSRSWAADGPALDNINAAEAELGDAELVAAARSDPAAFTPLYRRYFRPVYRYCYIRLGSHEAAEDATSDTFLKALTALGKYRNQGFAGWLFRIAHNTVVDAQRRQRPEVPFEQAGELADSAPTPEAASLERADYEDLHASLALLPAAQRTVLELQLAGLNSKQIGAAIGRGAGTVRMIRYRAFNQLRELIKAHHSEASPEVANDKP